MSEIFEHYSNDSKIDAIPPALNGMVKKWEEASTALEDTSFEIDQGENNILYPPGYIYWLRRWEPNHENESYSVFEPHRSEFEKLILSEKYDSVIVHV